MEIRTENIQRKWKLEIVEIGSATIDNSLAIKFFKNLFLNFWLLWALARSSLGCTRSVIAVLFYDIQTDYQFYLFYMLKFAILFIKVNVSFT